MCDVGVEGFLAAPCPTYILLREFQIFYFIVIYHPGKSLRGLRLVN